MSSYKVVQFTLDGKYIDTFDSLNNAGRSIGKANGGAIGDCCKHSISQAYGYRWLYEEEAENAEEVFKKYPLFNSLNNEVFSNTEIWRSIDGFYYVSKYGELRNRMGKVLSTHKDTLGYEWHSVKKIRKYGNSVHIIVARFFPEICGEWFEGAFVDHIDGNPSNNNAENLKVCDMVQNMANPVTKERLKNRERYGCPVLQYTLDGKFVDRYDNIAIASEKTGISTAGIGGVCDTSEKSKQRKTIGGYVWKYETVEDLPGEVWRITDFFETKYPHYISNMGRVKSRTGNLIQCKYLCGGGYKRLNHKPVHRAVAKAFPEICGEWFEGCVVDHLNGVREDNRAENLRVGTQVSNMNNGRTKNLLSKPILFIDRFKIIVTPSEAYAIKRFKTGKRTIYQNEKKHRKLLKRYWIHKLYKAI